LRRTTKSRPRSARGAAFFVAAFIAGCSGDPQTRGGLSKAEADELNAAAEELDEQQQKVDEALARGDDTGR